jgi:CBS domain containing-hemolysin-like protein
VLCSGSCRWRPQKGFSRIPVYGDSPNDLRGLILTKDLNLVTASDNVTLRQFLRMFGRQCKVRIADVDADRPLGFHLVL